MKLKTPSALSSNDPKLIQSRSPRPNVFSSNCMLMHGHALIRYVTPVYPNN